MICSKLPEDEVGYMQFKSSHSHCDYTIIFKCMFSTGEKNLYSCRQHSYRDSFEFFPTAVFRSVMWQAISKNISKFAAKPPNQFVF